MLLFSSGDGLELYHDETIAAQKGLKSIPNNPCFLVSSWKQVSQTELQQKEMSILLACTSNAKGASPNSLQIDEQVATQGRRAKQECQSDEFVVRQLYFDTFSSSIVKMDTPQPLKRVLDGSSGNVQFEYFIQKIEQYLRVNGKSASSILQTRFREIQKALSRARQTALISSCIQNPLSTEQQAQVIETLQQDTLDKVLKLPKNASHLFLAGYTEQYDEMIDGHAVALEVTRCEEKSYDVVIFNTGEGAEFHERSGKRKVFPIQWKQLSENSIRDITLGLERWVHGELTSMKEIYDLLNSHGRERITRPEGCSPYNEQGPIGSCIHKAIRVWIHHKLRDFAPEEYFLFRKFCTEDLLDRAKRIHEDVFDNISGISEEHLKLVVETAEAVFHRRILKGRTPLKIELPQPVLAWRQ